MKKAMMFLIAVSLAQSGISQTPTKKDLQNAKINSCFSGDCQNGTGVFITSSWGYYEGEFRDGKFHGKGEKHYGGEVEFKGEFRNGKTEGKGTEYKHDKIIFTGEYRDGKRHGKGTYFGENYKYEGEFNKGMITGKGVLTAKNGIRYEGDFVKGRKNGRGLLTNGIVTYDGEWQDDYFHGKGVLYQADKKIILEGIWKEGSSCAPVVGDCNNGSGISIIFYEGLASNRLDYYRYEGEWKNGKYHGKGKLIWPKGGVQEGQFAKGIYIGTGEPGEMKAWVNAAGGLRLRDKPSTSGRVVFVIPNFREVEVLEESGDVLTISGASGKWSRVKYKDESGWAFGGFLSLVEPDKSPMWKELKVKLKGFPRHWTELTLIKGKYYIFKPCYSQVRGISIDSEGTAGPEITRGLGQASDQYLILDVVKTKSGALFTILNKHSSKPVESKLEMIKEPDGKKVLWRWGGGSGESFHVVGNYIQGGGTPDFPSLKERDGDCGPP